MTNKTIKQSWIHMCALHKQIKLTIMEFEHRGYNMYNMMINMINHDDDSLVSEHVYFYKHTHENVHAGMLDPFII